MKNQSPS